MNLNEVTEFINNSLKQTDSEHKTVYTPGINPQIDLDLAKQLFKNNLYEQAEPLLILCADTAHLPEAYVMLGSLYFTQNKKELAQKYWTTAAEKHNIAHAHSSLGYLFRESGDTQAAINHFEQAEKDPKTVEFATTQLGLIYLGMDNETEKAKKYLHAASDTHKSPEASAGLGLLYLSEQNRELGVRYLMRAPEMPAALYHIGVTFMQEGKHKRATSYLHKAADTHKFAPAFYALGNLYLAKNDIQEAKKYLHSAVDEHNMPQAYCDLGYAYYKSNDLPTAENYFRQAIEKHNVKEAFNLLGSVLRELKQFDEAKKYLTIAADEHKIPSAFLNLGLLHEELGELETAKNYLHIAADEHNNPMAMIALNAIYEKENNTEKAQEYKDKAYATMNKNMQQHQEVGA